MYFKHNLLLNLMQAKINIRFMFNLNNIFLKELNHKEFHIDCTYFKHHHHLNYSRFLL